MYRCCTADGDGNGCCRCVHGDRRQNNITTASVDELTQLERVGAKYAEKIVAYREANGPFEKPEDIMLVKGIGEKVWELNKEMITVGTETAAKTGS